MPHQLTKGSQSKGQNPLRAVTILRHGVTLSTRSGHQRKGGPRGRVTCWSPGAARRNVAFLRSVDERELEGVGLAFTLTLRTCPPTPAAWASCITRWVKRQRRGGCSVLHWVMEFQRRGVPHLHVAAWYDPESLRPCTVAHERKREALHRMQDGTEGHRRAGLIGVVDWLEVASEFEPGSGGQQVRPLVGPVGWFQYLAKHCGRGADHYQRQQAAMPTAWPSAPRAWGKSGPWPLVPPVELAMGSEAFYKLRRLIRRQRVAKARAAVPGPGWTWHNRYAPLFERGQTRDLPIHPRRIIGGKGKPLRYHLRNLQHARSMLRCSLPELSAVRGVSEWIDQAAQGDLMRALGIDPADMHVLGTATA